jgi:quinol monooxygenase YgiN
MATILAHITVHPGMAPRFEAIARDLYAATHANEPGVVRYEYWRGANENAYYALLSFDEYDAFIAHQISDYHEAAGPLLTPVVAAIRLEWVDPVGSAAPLPATAARRSADPSESERARYYASRYPAELAEWWSSLRVL